MSYWVFLLTLMVIGMCDAFGQFLWRHNLPSYPYESKSLHSQRKREILRSLEPASRIKRFDDPQNIANSLYKGRRTSRNSELPEARYTIFNYGPSNSTRDLQVLNRPEKKFARSTRRKRTKRQSSRRVSTVPTNRLFDDDTVMQSDRNRRSKANRQISELEVAGQVRSDNLDSAIDESNGRRFYWEPIFDGGVIGSVGRLFGDKIKDEADRERIEREEIRNEKLIKKYTAMLNDPEQYKKLQQESANSPSYINQVVRGTLFPRLEEKIEE
ncbi:uncharacterized protein LOC124416016 [Diprion similis]|uniref:uncharacterized protein LOC124416016 n=1 Tax=Diprion similis TaxID=362088 RepID=UPI001EF7F016|nr:uncharacterized protein LOC124416016 [Diprion similis]